MGRGRVREEGEVEGWRMRKKGGGRKGNEIEE